MQINPKSAEPVTVDARGFENSFWFNLTNFNKVNIE